MSLASIGNFFKHLGQEIHDGLVKIFGQSALDSVESQIKGISLGTSAVNLGIELVVNLLKAKGGAGFAG